MADPQDITSALGGIQNVPFHIHNGLDAPQLPFSSIRDYTVSTDGTMAADSQTILPTQSAVVTYINSRLGAPYFFGDGSDGALSKADGSTTNLTRDTFYTDITLSNNSLIITNGFRVFASGILTLGTGGNIQYNGNAGGNADNNGTTVNPGAAAGALAAGSVPGGIAGAAGSSGHIVANNTFGVPGTAGVNGTAANPSIGSTGANNSSSGGGAGGSGGGTSGGTSAAGGTAGTATPALNLPRTVFPCYENFDQVPTFALHMGSGGAGSGAGGSGGGAQGSPSAGFGGGGGGSGGTGGVVVVFAKTIINGVAGGIQALGGTGGNGGKAINVTLGPAVNVGGCGGGQGGAGGAGGVIIIVYNSLTQNGTFLVTGGSGGTGGNGGLGAGSSFSNGSNGGSGTTGTTGLVWQVQII